MNLYTIIFCRGGEICLRAVSLRAVMKRFSIKKYGDYEVWGTVGGHR